MQVNGEGSVLVEHALIIQATRHRRQEQEMTTWQIVRLAMGALILTSLALGLPNSPVFLSSWWLVLTAGVGLNLVQGAVTLWCPLEAVLRRLGVRAGH
jgi:hypothetical protein